MTALMILGVAAIHVSELAEGAAGSLSKKQAVFCCLGIAVFLGVSFVPYQRIGRLAYVLFAATLGLLVLVLFLPPIRYSHRWIDLKIVLLQPSEIAKITYIILLAWYLRYGNRYRRLRGLAVPFILTFVPMGLILVEPDLGTCLLLLPTLYIMLFMAGARVRHLLGIVAVATVLILLPTPRNVSRLKPLEARDRRNMAYGRGESCWTFHAGGSEYVMSAAIVSMMRHHQLTRIEGWVRQGNPEVAQSKAYQLHHSKMVLAAGRWTGRGRSGDIGGYFHLLPDDHTDFIFSVIGGQWGFLGCLGLFVLYGVLFAFGIEVAVVTDEPFGRLLAIGVLALLFSQILINVGMTLGLMPITGMTLPLVSYGGSSLLVNCAAMGLLANVSRHRPIQLARKPFEHGE